MNRRIAARATLLEENRSPARLNAGALTSLIQRSYAALLVVGTR
jgi:hypothetical protein